MYGKYDVCDRRTFDTVRQLMKLAEEDNAEAFFRLADENSGIFLSEYAFAEAAVTIGLIARNKASLLDGFLKKILPKYEGEEEKRFDTTGTISNFVGTLIM